MSLHAQSIQLCLALCDPMDCSPSGSSVHGIPQARILEWVAMPLLQGIFPTQGLNMYLLHCRQILYRLSHQGRLHSSRPQPAGVTCCEGRFLELGVSPKLLEPRSLTFPVLTSLFKTHDGDDCWGFLLFSLKYSFSSIKLEVTS